MPAEKASQTVAAVAPGDGGQTGRVRAHCADAEKFLYQDRLQEAKTAVQNALRLSPRDPAALNILGVIALQQGEIKAAVAAIGKASTLQPDAPEPRHFLGLAYGRMGRYEEAVASFRSALALRPQSTRTLAELSSLLRILGRRDEARDCLLELLAADPADLNSYMALAELSPRSLTDDHFRILQQTAGDETGRGRARAFANFALASLYESHGKFDQEFACLRLANDHMRDSLATIDDAPISIMPQKERPRFLPAAEALTRVSEARAFAETMFNAEFLRRFTGGGHPSSLPIFIVGMPRSGSSLIEQILSSHPAVHGAGEINAFHEHCVTGRWPFEGFYQRDALGALMPSEPRARHFRILGANYVKALRALAPKAQHVINKMPGLFMHIGMIHLCLPNAIIIHSVRDPVDTCLGCYKRPFLTGNETTYDLDLLGRHYQEYRRAMSHWQRVLPGRVIDVVHEDLVREPESQIRRLLESCGIDWDERCLRPHENPKPVLTSSQTQLREPIHSASIQRWRRYEQHLGPLLNALGPFAPED